MERWGEEWRVEGEHIPVVHKYVYISHKLYVDMYTCMQLMYMQQAVSSPAGRRGPKTLAVEAASPQHEEASTRHQ